MDKDRLGIYAISGMNYMYMHSPIVTPFYYHFSIQLFQITYNIG